MSRSAATTRHALGWPPGSIRALLALMVAGLVCALMLIPPRDPDKPTPIPAYLLYLLFLILGHYFAARGSSVGQTHALTDQPLWLPRHTIRLLLLVGLVGTCVYKIVTDRHAFDEQWEVTARAMQDWPLLPLIVQLAFFAGVILRWIIGPQPGPWFQDLEAWFSLIAVLLMSITTLMHLVIYPSLSEYPNLPFWEGMLASVVAFYFGERS
jgi:hypothetical protein